MRASSICCCSFRREASVSRACKPVLLLPTLLVLAEPGRSKNTVTPAPQQKDRLYSASVSGLSDCGRAKPSHVLCAVHCFFRRERTWSNTTECPSSSSKLWHVGTAEAWTPWAGRGRALTFHACRDLGKSLKQEKEGFLHVDGELSRSERPPKVIIAFAPPKDLGSYGGKLAGRWAGWLCRSSGGCSDE